MDEEKVQQVEYKTSWNATDYEKQIQSVDGLAEPTRRLVEAAHWMHSSEPFPQRWHRFLRKICRVREKKSAKRCSHSKGQMAG